MSASARFRPFNCKFSIGKTKARLLGRLLSLRQRLDLRENCKFSIIKTKVRLLGKCRIRKSKALGIIESREFERQGLERKLQV